MEFTTHVPSLPRMRWLRSFFRFRITTLILWVVLLAWLFHDQPLDPHPERLQPRLNPPEEENAYTVLDEVELELAEDEKSVKAILKAPWDPDQAEALLRDKARALDLFRTALSRPVLEFPECRALTDKLPHVQTYLTLAKLIRLQVRWFAEKGHPEQATAALLDLQRISIRLAERPEHPIAGLMAMGALQYLAEGLEDFLRYGTSDSGQVERLLRGAPDTRMVAGIYRAAALRSCAQARNTLFRSNELKRFLHGDDDARPAEKWMSFFLFRPGRTCNEFAASCIRLAEWVEAPALLLFADDKNIGEFNALMERIKPTDEKPRIYTRNSYGNMLHKVLFEQNLNLAPLAAVTTLRCDLTRLGLALRLHQLQNGDLPASLAELSPAILPSLPKDRFTGDSYGYDPEGARVYSFWPLSPNTGKPMGFLKAIQVGPEEPAPDPNRNWTQFFFTSRTSIEP